MHTHGRLGLLIIGSIPEAQLKTKFVDDLTSDVAPIPALQEKVLKFLGVRGIDLPLQSIFA